MGATRGAGAGKPGEVWWVRWMAPLHPLMQPFSQPATATQTPLQAPPQAPPRASLPSPPPSRPESRPPSLPPPPWVRKVSVPLPCPGLWSPGKWCFALILFIPYREMSVN